MLTSLEKAEAAATGQYRFEVTRSIAMVEEKVGEAFLAKRIDAGTATMIRKQLREKVVVSEELLRMLWQLE